MNVKKPTIWLCLSATVLSGLFFSCSLETFHPQIKFTVNIPGSPESRLVRVNPSLSDMSCYLISVSSSSPAYPQSVNIPSYSQSCLGLDQFVAAPAYSYTEITAGAQFLAPSRDTVGIKVYGVKTFSGNCAPTAAETLMFSPRPKLFLVGKTNSSILEKTSEILVPVLYDQNNATNLFGSCLKLFAFSGNSGLPSSTPSLNSINGGIPPVSEIGGNMLLLLNDYVAVKFLLTRAVSVMHHQRIDFVHPLRAKADLDNWSSLKFFIPKVTAGGAGPTTSPDCYASEYTGTSNDVALSLFYGGLPQPMSTWASPVSSIEGTGVSITLSPTAIRDAVTPSVGMEFPFGVLVSVVANHASDSNSCSGLSFGAPVELSLLP